MSSILDALGGAAGPAGPPTPTSTTHQREQGEMQQPETMPENAGGDAGKDAASLPPPALDWASMTPSEKAREAARIRWARREEAKPEETPAESVVYVHVRVQVGKIIRAYSKAAEKGDANAGRELRAWLDRFPPEDSTLTPDQLDARTIDRLLQRLLSELDAEDAADGLIR
jgi:hypothetical protein